MQGGERYYSISDYLKTQFGRKTIKLSIDAGFTCPNRDGTLAYGGCAFCSSEGSGDFASSYVPGSVSESIDKQIAQYASKWPDAACLAYFQAHTNTYAPVGELRTRYYEALADPRIEGIVIATRPDCISDEVLDLLDEINRSHFMWVELGLQTIHRETSELMGICCELSSYEDAVDRLLSRNIKVVTHLILGLPSSVETDESGRIFASRETDGQILDSVRFVCQKPIFGLKLHLLNVVTTSRLYHMLPDYVAFGSIDEYVDLVVRCLEIIPPGITIHRLTADAPRKILVSPEWSYMKRTILNNINRELKERDTRQGARSVR